MIMEVTRWVTQGGKEFETALLAQEAEEMEVTVAYLDDLDIEWYDVGPNSLAKALHKEGYKIVLR